MPRRDSVELRELITVAIFIGINASSDLFGEDFDAKFVVVDVVVHGIFSQRFCVAVQEWVGSDVACFSIATDPVKKIIDFDVIFRERR